MAVNQSHFACIAANAPDYQLRTAKLVFIGSDFIYAAI